MFRPVHALFWLPLLVCALCSPAVSTAAKTPDASASRSFDTSPLQTAPLDLRLVDVHGGDTFEKTAGVASTPLGRDACADTFVIYGGEGTLEGKFQTAQFAPDWQGWSGLDFTDQDNAWHVSTFNAENLGANGVGNQAMWIGYEAADRPFWSTPPGYGNDWVMDLQWDSGPLADTQTGQTVSLDFFFNFDTEPGYDFMSVEYDSAGQWKTVLLLDGSNRDAGGDFLEPGLRFSDQSALPIVYVGGDYAGSNDDRIRIRVRFESDGAWSDQDGLWDTDGAIQLDDVVVAWTDDGQAQTSTESFEGGGLYEWQAASRPLAGDFAKIFPRFQDIDPCSENTTPVLTFIDDGTPPSNDPLQRSTGGSTSVNWSYGVPGGWVSNYTGGLSFGETPLHNAAISPPIPWDVAGTCDDTVEFDFLVFEADYFLHTPGAVVGYRSYRWSEDGGVNWSDWKDDGSIPVGTGEWLRWKTRAFPLEGPSTPTHVQVAFQAWDISEIFNLPLDGSPAPVFDNVRVMKVRSVTPAVGWGDFQDAFAYSGGSDVSTQAARDQLDIPMADVLDDPSDGLDPIEMFLRPTLSGVTIDQVSLFWTLEKNPLFEDAIRQVPARPQDVDVDVSDPNQWFGEVQGVLVDGDVTNGFWDVDLPDVDFMYPGDVFRQYFRIVDSDGRVITLPEDISGFETGNGYPRFYYTRNGLPSYRSTTGETPRMLVIQRAGFPARLDLALAQLGLEEGVDFDRWDRLYGFTLNFQENGIGASGRGGATVDQLSSYDTILYIAEDRLGTWSLLGDGQVGSDDVGLLTAWRELPGPRNLALFGSDLARALTLTPKMSVFLQDVLGVDFQDANVRDEIGDRLVNIADPEDPAFSAPIAVSSNCANGEGPDSIRPNGNAQYGHRFLTSSSAPSSGAASVLKSQIIFDDLKRTAFFPFALTGVSGVVQKAPDTASTSAKLLEDLLFWFGVPTANPGATDAPSARPVLSELSTSPNPFNPRLSVSFEVGRKGRATVEVFNLRGERVATLLDEEIEAGPQQLVWDGKDHAGAQVASGVYLVRAQSADVQMMKKVALIR